MIGPLVPDVWRSATVLTFIYDNVTPYGLTWRRTNSLSMMFVIHTLVFARNYRKSFWCRPSCLIVQGERFNEFKKDNFYQIQWRPRPASLLSSEEKRRIIKNLRKVGTRTPNM